MREAFQTRERIAELTQELATFHGEIAALLENLHEHGKHSMETYTALRVKTRHQEDVLGRLREACSLQQVLEDETSLVALITSDLWDAYENKKT